jgi:hypothetical protein
VSPLLVDSFLEGDSFKLCTAVARSAFYQLAKKKIIKPSSIILEFSTWLEATFSCFGLTACHAAFPDFRPI